LISNFGNLQKSAGIGEKLEQNSRGDRNRVGERIAIVMAAGKGTRMKSELPKVLVPVCGRPMIDYVLQALRQAGVGRQIVVIGHRAELVERHLGGQPDVTFVRQTQQLGTGHAVMMCRQELADFDGPVLVVAGDSPLMQSDSIEALFAEFDQARPACILGTGYRDDPTGFGRILRDPQGRFAGIVEEKDASDQQRQIREVNLSCYVFNCRDLLVSLQQLDNTNVQGEYYVTDCPGILLNRGLDVRALDVLKPCEALSINTVNDVRQVEAEMQRRQQAGT
jgi:bifunctional UDP-N-acetylglucosamine pyrophosphorylase/glucosamine-1-phosphate N-acetyltransferase/UDP-N-acetylglucosamine pyrophosphorylase